MPAAAAKSKLDSQTMVARFLVGRAAFGVRVGSSLVVGSCLLASVVSLGGLALWRLPRLRVVGGAVVVIASASGGDQSARAHNSTRSHFAVVRVVRVISDLPPWIVQA